MDVGGVEDVAQFVAGQAVEAGIPGVEFGTQPGAAVGGERERGEGRGASGDGLAVALGPGGADAVTGGFAFRRVAQAVPDVLELGPQVVGGVGKFQDAGDDEGEVGRPIVTWG